MSCIHPYLLLQSCVSRCRSYVFWRYTVNCTRTFPANKKYSCCACSPSENSQSLFAYLLLVRNGPRRAAASSKGGKERFIGLGIATKFYFKMEPREWVVEGWLHSPVRQATSSSCSSHH